uniref:Gag-Pol polyprotein n=1 Tax=Tanacetum cinerariifolium TaxID=118510 RepID=A0A699J9V3_TANCI|nr:Gag-Pol polyprotein [Tanacetum cinerariifolium]
MEDNLIDLVNNDPFVNMFAPEPSSEASSSRDVSLAESTYVTQTHYHLEKWSKDYPLDKVIGNPSRPLSTRNQLETDALWCFYNFVLSKVEPKNFKYAITEDCWFQAMQDEIHEFDQLRVWELVPRPHSSSSANKKPEYVMSVKKKEDKKADEKKRDMSKVKCYNCKKEGHFAKDCKKAKVKDNNYYKTKMLLAKKDSDEQVLLAED